MLQALQQDRVRAEAQQQQEEEARRVRQEADDQKRRQEEEAALKLQRLQELKQRLEASLPVCAGGGAAGWGGWV